MHRMTMKYCREKQPTTDIKFNINVIDLVFITGKFIYQIGR